MFRAVGCRRRSVSSCCSAPGLVTVQSLSCTSCTIKTMFPLYPFIHTCTHTPDLYSWYTHKQCMTNLIVSVQWWYKVWILVNESQSDFIFYLCLTLYGRVVLITAWYALNYITATTLHFRLEYSKCKLVWFLWLVSFWVQLPVCQILCCVSLNYVFSWPVKFQKTWVRMSDWFRVCVLCCWGFVSTIMTTA